MTHEFLYYTKNRRLYSYTLHAHTSLKDVKALVLAGEEVRVRAMPGERDITARALCEVLLSQIKQGAAKPTVKEIVALILPG